MFCSTIIATIGRKTLSRAAESVLTQAFDKEDFELIIVNDSGKPLLHEAWQASSRVSIINTNRRERSIARNTGAAMAHGRYLHFLDDDDWFLPDALSKFWEKSHINHPIWMYGSSLLVDRNGNELIQLHHGLSGNCFLHAMAGEWIPLQSSLVDSTLFHELGGFNPLITGPEDIDLLRRITLHGEVAEVESVIACIEMGERGSTTDYSQHPEISRLAREEILDMPGVFNRMRNAAQAIFWHGKFSRIYLTSVVWNIEHRRLFTALCRFIYLLWSLILAGRMIFAPNFWSSMGNSYKSFTFERGIREAEGKF